MSKIKAKAPTLILGPLPVEVINRTIGTNLLAGDIVLTSGGQIHANRNHPRDYPKCLPHLASVVSAPLYIGDDFANSGIELISRPPLLKSAMLVAVSIVRNESGQYEISSFYTAAEGKIQSRREKGFLRVALYT